MAYEILPGNTSDSKALRSFLAKIEHQYGKAQRVWCMDRGMPTEAVLEEMLRRRQLKWLWARLAQLQSMPLERDELRLASGRGAGEKEGASART